MQSISAETQAAIEAGNQEVIPRVTVEWLNSRFIENLNAFSTADNYVKKAKQMEPDLFWQLAEADYASQVRTKHPLANLWMLDETSGTVINDYNNIIDGTSSGTPTLNQSSKITTGSILFDGINDYISVNHNVRFSPGYLFGFLTVETWINPISVTAGTLLGKGDVDGSRIISNGYEWKLNLVAGKIKFTIFEPDGTNYLAATGTTTITTGSWHHIVATWDGKVIKIYLDGQFEVEARLDTGFRINMPYPNTSKVNIGRMSTATDYYSGYMNGVAIYNTVVEPSEIIGHYNVGIGKTYDYSGNSRSGFLVNPNSTAMVKVNDEIVLNKLLPPNRWIPQFTGTEYIVHNGMPGSEDFTAEVWAKPDHPGTSVAGTIFGKGASVASDIMQFGFDVVGNTGSTEHFLAYVDNAAGTRFSIAASVSDLTTAWHHLVIVVVNNILTFYINGVSIGSPQTITGSRDTFNYSITVARNGSIITPTLYSGLVINPAYFPSAAMDHNKVYCRYHSVIRENVSDKAYDPSFMGADELVNGHYGYGHVWATLGQKDKNRTKINLSSNYDVAEDTTQDKTYRYQYGWTGNYQSQTDGTFNNGQSIVLAFDAISCNAIGLYVPQEFGKISEYDLYYKDTSDVWHTVASTWEILDSNNMIHYLAGGVTTITGISMFIYGTQIPVDHAQVAELTPLVIDDVSDDIVSLSIKKTRENFDSSVPFGATAANSADFTLQNVDLRYNPNNVDSDLYGLLTPDAKFKVELGWNNGGGPNGLLLDGGYRGESSSPRRNQFSLGKQAEITAFIKPTLWGGIDPTIIFSDSYNRANSSSSLGSTDSAFGGSTTPWIPQSGTWGILVNKPYLVSATTNATIVIETNSSDCRLELVYDSDNVAHGLIWRSTNNDNYFCYQGPAGAGAAFRVQSGGFNFLASDGVGASLGDIVVVDISGNVHTIYVNGVQEIQFTDSFQNTATKHGIRINNDSTTFPDNFKVTVDVLTGNIQNIVGVGQPPIEAVAGEILPYSPPSGFENSGSPCVTPYGTGTYLVGGGIGSARNAKFWIFDPADQSFTPIDASPSNNVGTASTVGGVAYVWQENFNTPALQTYNGSWSAPGTFADPPLSFITSVDVGTDIYLSSYNGELYKYNTLTDAYTALASVPIVSGLNFVFGRGNLIKYNGDLYLVIGETDSGYITPNLTIWKYIIGGANAGWWSNKGTASSPDVTHLGNVPSHAIDGDISSWWQPISATVNPTWTLDRGASPAGPFTSILINWYNAAFGGVDYTIQTSPDNSSWTTIVTVTGNALDNNTHTFAATNARYVKIVITARNSDAGDTYAHLAMKEFALNAPLQNVVNSSQLDYFGTAVVGDEIYITGGYNNIGPDFTSDEIRIYNITDNTLAIHSSVLPVQQAELTSIYDSGSDAVWTFGGWDNDLASYSGIVEAFYVSGGTISASELSWNFTLLDNGKLRWVYSQDGTTSFDVDSTVSLEGVFATSGYVRVTQEDLTTDTRIKFWYSTNNITWTQLGSSILLGSSITLFNSSDDLEIGAINVFSRKFTGTIYTVEIRDSINGVIVANPDFRSDTKSVHSTSLLDHVGNSFNINSSAVLASGGVEYIKQGTFYADTYQVDSTGMINEINCRDSSKFLQETTKDTGIIFKNMTAGEAIGALAKEGGILNVDVSFDLPYSRQVIRDNPVAYWDFSQLELDNWAFNFNGATRMTSNQLFYMNRLSRLDNDVVYPIVEMWVKGTDADATLFNFATSGQVNRLTISIVSGDIVYKFNGSASSSVNVNINDGKWHYLVSIVQSGNTIKTYMDGKDFGTVALTTADMGGDVGYITLGNAMTTWPATFGSTFYTGYMDQVRVSNGLYEDILEQIPWNFNKNSASTYGKEYNTLAYYAMDEGTGSTISSTKDFFNKLTVNGTASWVKAGVDTLKDRAGWHHATVNSLNTFKEDGPLISESGRAYGFADNVVTVQYDSSFDFDDSMSFEAWVYKASTPNNTINMLLHRPSVFSIYITDDNHIVIDSTSGGIVTSTGTINNATYHHIVVSVDALAVSFYIDGVLSGTGSLNSAFAVNDNLMYIGNSLTASTFWTGRIAAMSVFTYGIDSSVIAAHYKASLTPKPKVYELLWGTEDTLWADMLTIALGDLGMFYITEEDVFRYESAVAFYNNQYGQHGTVQWHLDENTNIISGSQNIELLVNKVIVIVNPVQSLSNPTQEIWSASSGESLAATTLTAAMSGNSDTLSFSTIVNDAGLLEPIFPANGFVRIGDEIIKYDSGDDFNLYGLTRGMFETTIGSYGVGEFVGEAREYNLQWSDTPIILVKYPFITAELFDGTVEVNLWNSNPTSGHLVISLTASFDADDIYQVLQGNNPITGLDNFFAIAGTPAIDTKSKGATSQVSSDYQQKIRRYGLKDMTIDNPFIQDAGYAKQVADFVLQHNSSPVKVINIQTLGLPHLQLGDRIEIDNFAQLSIEGIDYWIMDIDTSYNGGVSQTLTLKQVD